jgi:hypothetical protein
MKSKENAVETPDQAVADRQPRTDAMSAATAGPLDERATPSTERSDNSSTPAKSATTGKYRPSREWPKTWLPAIEVSLAVLGLVVLALQLWLMFRQTAIMNAQTQLSDQSLHAFRVSERAYVGVESLTADLKAGEVVIMLHNIGSVPAQTITVDVREIRVTPSTNLDTTATGERINESHKGSEFQWEAGEVQLFPGTPMPILVSLERFNEDEMNAITSKKEVLYVGGTIRYDDGFGKKDRTVFAFRYNPSNQKWTAHSDLSKVLKALEQ